MREDYAKKNSDMLEKTRLVRNLLHVHMYTQLVIIIPLHSVQERGGACCR